MDEKNDKNWKWSSTLPVTWAGTQFHNSGNDEGMCADLRLRSLTSCRIVRMRLSCIFTFIRGLRNRCSRLTSHSRFRARKARKFHRISRPAPVHRPSMLPEGSGEDSAPRKPLPFDEIRLSVTQPCFLGVRTCTHARNAITGLSPFASPEYLDLRRYSFRWLRNVEKLIYPLLELTRGIWLTSF